MSSIYNSFGLSAEKWKLINEKVFWRRDWYHIYETDQQTINSTYNIRKPKPLIIKQTHI